MTTTAEQDALEILVFFWGRHPDGSLPLPVDPFAIARELGIQVFTDETLDPDIAGKLIKEPTFADPVIVLNGRDSRNRQRFTCAHELGHYNKRVKSGDLGEWEFIDHRDNLARTGTNPDEIYANQFAAGLLMPADEMRRRAETEPVPLLAQVFGVSADALAFRLQNLQITA